MNLYELTGDFLKLQQMLEQGEIDEQVFEDTMAGIEYDIEQKAEGYGMIIQNLQGYVDTLDAEINRLNGLKKSYSNNISRLKENLFKSMVAIKKKKFKTDHFAFSTRKSSAVKILDASKLPNAYIVKKTTTRPDKKKIKEDIKAGEKITGAEIEERESLTIK